MQNDLLRRGPTLRASLEQENKNVEVSNEQDEKLKEKDQVIE